MILLSRDGVLATAVERELEGAGLAAGMVRLEAWDQLASNADLPGGDVILLDGDCDAFPVETVLAAQAGGARERAVILILRPEKSDVAVDAIRRGADNFIFKDRLARLGPAVWRARHNCEQRRRCDLASRALLTSERLLKATGRIARIGGWSIDLTSDTLHWTTETRRIHEVDPDYKPSVESALEFYAPSARPVIQDALERAMADGIPWDLELPLITAKGNLIWARAQGEAVIEQGRVVALLGAFQEITERKQAEERLAQQAALIDMVPNAIVLRDLNHRVLFWSRGAERIYGWSAAEAIGRDFRELPGINRAELDAVERTVQDSGTWQGELSRRLPNGDSQILNGHWMFLRDPEGWPASILSIDTDVTDRKKLEMQFLRAQRLESIGTLAGGIAHDLNNILSPILMAGDLLREHVRSDTGRSLLDNIGRSARRGADLVKQVLSFARGAEGERVPVQIRHIVREIEDIVINTFPKNITFEADLGKAPPLIMGDPTQITQVFMNLCVNARDAMPDGGKLAITAGRVELDARYVSLNKARSTGPYLVVHVADEGVGMSPEVVEHIFEPFYTTKEKGKGTGLGLSTVQAIMRGHGGILSVRSEPGRGSVFSVYFPISNETPADGEPGGRADEMPRGQGETVLLVDDEASILMVTRQTLQNFGYRVLVAGDGAVAVSVFTQRVDEIDLVLTDMMMPVMDGAVLVTALRRINPRIRVIASSGLTGAGGGEQVASARVRHFLPKPYSMTTMLRVVRAALDEPLP